MIPCRTDADILSIPVGRIPPWRTDTDILTDIEIGRKYTVDAKDHKTCCFYDPYLDFEGKGWRLKGGGGIKLLFSFSSVRILPAYNPLRFIEISNLINKFGEHS